MGRVGKSYLPQRIGRQSGEHATSPGVAVELQQFSERAARKDHRRPDLVAVNGGASAPLLRIGPTGVQRLQVGGCYSVLIDMQQQKPGGVGGHGDFGRAADRCAKSFGPMRIDVPSDRQIGDYRGTLPGLAAQNHRHRANVRLQRDAALPPQQRLAAQR